MINRLWILLAVLLAGCASPQRAMNDPAGWEDLLTCSLQTEAAHDTYNDYMAWLSTVVRNPPFVDREAVGMFGFNPIVGMNVKVQSALKVFDANVIGYSISGSGNRSVWFSAVVEEDMAVLRDRFVQANGMTVTRVEDNGDIVLKPRTSEYPSGRIMEGLELSAPSTAQTILVAPKSPQAITVVVCGVFT